MKLCACCRVEKPLEEFSTDSWQPDGKNPWCRSCVREKDRQLRQKKKAIIDEFKSQPCADCGNEYPPYVMDLDHVVGEKKFRLAEFSCWGIQAILDELQKCEVVCSNCHRIRTKSRQEVAA